MARRPRRSSGLAFRGDPPRPLDLGAEVAGLGDESLDLQPDQRLHFIGADALLPRAALAVYLVAVRELAAVAGDTVHGRLPPELLGAMRACATARRR